MRTRSAALALAFLLSLAASARAAIGTPTVTPLGLSTTTVQWSWLLTANATGYRVLSSTGGGNISGDLSASATYFALTGLSTNTAVTATVEAFGVGGTAAASASAAYSLAAAPSGTLLLGQDGPAETLSWAVNGNPAGTTYQVFWSTSGGTPNAFSTAPAVVAGSATATVPSLPGGYTVYLRVLALNGLSQQSAFDVQLSTYVPALAGQPAISSGTYALGVSSIAWSWNVSTGALNYRLFTATGGAFSPLLPPTQFSFTQTGLTANTSYSAYVVAYSTDSGGVQVSTASPPFARYTLAAVPAALATDRLRGSFEDLSWTANGNPAYTTYDVLWWTGVTSTVTYSTASLTTSAGVLPAGGTVYFAVRARNYEGLATDFEPSLYTAVKSTYFAVGVTTVPASFSGTLTFAIPTGAVYITVSSQTFASDVTLTIQTPAPSSVPGLSPGQSSLGTPVVFSLTALDAYGAALQPTRPIALNVALQPGVLGSVVLANAVLARYDAVHGAWVPLLTQRQSGAVSALTDHLSTFQLLGGAGASDLSSVSVGPNPLRPSLYPGTAFTFRGLPGGARVRVFTVLGERVADLTADAAGLLTWDARNPYGALVGSGVYIAVIEGPGKRTMRLAVER